MSLTAAAKLQIGVQLQATQVRSHLHVRPGWSFKVQDDQEGGLKLLHIV